MSSLSSGTAGAGRYSCPADSGPRDNHSLIVGFAVTFTQLRAFATVARLGSLSAAAAALGVSEPAVCSALRWPRLEVAQEVASPRDFAALLADRRADVVLGPSPASDLAIEAVPFLRYKLIVVASPRHRLAGVRGVSAGELGRERWLVGPVHDDLDRLLDRAGVRARKLGAFATEAAAQAAAAAGEGVSLAIAHTVHGALRSGSLVRVDAVGSPLDGMWHAATLGAERASREAGALRRYVTSPEATQAIVARPGGVPAGRFRPPGYVTI